MAFRFAGEDVYRAAAARYHEGEFPFSGLLERVFAPIRATREEIAAFARERASWRPGFETFLDACRAAGRPFLVVSAGLDVYIEPVLDGREWLQTGFRADWGDEGQDAARLSLWLDFLYLIAYALILTLANALEYPYLGPLSVSIDPLYLLLQKYENP